jgi:putative membrane protein
MNLTHDVATTQPTSTRRTQMMYYGPGMNGWVSALIIVGNVVFWGLLIIATIDLIRYTKRGQIGLSFQTVSTPQEILAQRFARGAIDENEYTRRLQVLTGSSTSPPSR